MRSPTDLRHLSTNLISYIAATFNFKIWIHDLTQLYIQSTEKLMRKITLSLSENYIFGLKNF